MIVEGSPFYPRLTVVNDSHDNLKSQLGYYLRLFNIVILKV